jgi:hypothetical protein
MQIMDNNISNFSQSTTFKIITAVFLFSYFGFIIIPEWSRPFSARFLLWLSLLPIVVIALIATGIRGGIGLWREKVQKAAPNSQNKYFVWLASLGVLWFIISIALANTTYYAYFHQKFDPETWKNAGWEDGDLFQLSTRERMFDDLITNVLPGLTKAQMLDLLGEPDEQRDIKGEESFIYYYGQGIMDPDCLIIRFDDKDLIKDYGTSVCG